MINLIVKAIKIMNKVNVKQSLIIEIMIETIKDSLIINFLIISVLLLILTNNQVRILKNLWWLKFSLLILLNSKSQLNLLRFLIK